MNNFKVTPYYESIAVGNPPLLKQYQPDSREKNILPYEVSDPLDEKKHMITPRLIHRYADRVLVLVTDNCLLYCRHCFRRDFIGKGQNIITDSELDDVCKYIDSNNDVHEVLLSGGDPLTIPISRLSEILNRIVNIRPNLVIRIGTRVPIVSPGSITPELLELFRNTSSIWLALQCNHPLELTSEVQVAVDSLRFAGVTLVNQAVLLKGINDDSLILKDLCHKLLEFGIKPYYIFQGDLARGTSHLRVPLKEGLKIMGELRDLVSGLALPIYAVDIPGGGGKIHLTKDFIVDEDEDNYILKNSDGFIGKYPKE
ncbi:MAG: KamA family radical SAM protein [Spirochaetaceae bacterium]